MIATIQSSRIFIQFQCWIPFFLGVSLFAVPISESGRSIFVGIALALILMTPSYRKELVSTLSKPWCQALLGLLLLTFIACIWSPASSYEKISMIKKYSKLLFLPLLAVGFCEPRTRRIGLHAFLAAMLITCLLSLSKAAGLLTYNGGESGQVFRNHIMTGLMMSFAAYLSAWFCLKEQTSWRYLYALFVIVFSYQILFISSGRTGYVIYALMMFVFMVQTIPWRKLGFALMLGCSLFALSYYQSPIMQAAIKNVADGLHQYDHGNKNTSIGYRMQFHAFAKKLFLRHPIIGNGTGSYTYLFRKEDPVPAWQDIRKSPNKLFEPHSQYWLIASEFGLLGIGVLLFFFGSLLVASLRLDSMKNMAIALILLFMVGNLSDSLLFYSGTGYFFLILMGLCLGEEQTRQNGRGALEGNSVSDY